MDLKDNVYQPLFYDDIPRKVQMQRRFFPATATDDLLFSDYGDKSDSDDGYVISRKKQALKDERTTFSEAISAATLNSGTLIQLAIIGAELKNLVNSSLDKVTYFFMFSELI